MTSVYWLSFTDVHCPKGQQFLGVAIIEVTDADRTTAGPDLAWQFPEADPDAADLLAAVRKAWRLGCNPGGQVLSYEMPADDPARAAPRHRLLSRAELERYVAVSSLGEWDG